MVAEFMAKARGLLASGVRENTLNEIGRLLSKSSREPGFAPDADMRTLHGGDSSFTIVQTDPDGLTLMLARFSPLEETPVHDHNSWGVACVVRGRDRYRHWHHDDEGHLNSYGNFRNAVRKYGEVELFLARCLGGRQMRE